MSSDPVAAYQDALSKLKSATAATEAVVRVVVDAGKKLERWRGTVIASVGGGYPLELARAPGINARDWPSAATLHKALTDWHEANTAVRNAWNAIPQERRVGLTPPS